MHVFIVDLCVCVKVPIHICLRVLAAGITISPYQVKHAAEYIERDGLQEQCTVLEGDFMKLVERFGENSFDVVYAIEATCHAPKLQVLLVSFWKGSLSSLCVALN